MKEEDIIHKHDTGRQPFKVPEGYFDTFTDRLMSRLPERQTTPKVVSMKPWQRFVRYAAAAVVAGVCVAAGTYYYQRQSPEAQKLLYADQTELIYSDDDLDEVLDYAIVGNQEIAYYLTEAN